MEINYNNVEHSSVTDVTTKEEIKEQEVIK